MKSNKKDILCAQRQEKEYPPKVKAMFEAVLDLFASGRELSTLKVSEITRKAGIGKGTAYEYFSTKEEIIVGALDYEAGRQMKMINDLIENEQNFKDVMMMGFDMMESAFVKYRGFAIMTKIIKDNTLSEESMLTELEKHKGKCNTLTALIEKIANLALKEKLIQKADYYKMHAAIVSQVVVYALFIINQEWYPDVSKEQAKEAAYENILKLLN